RAARPSGGDSPPGTHASRRAAQPRCAPGSAPPGVAPGDARAAIHAPGALPPRGPVRPSRPPRGSARRAAPRAAPGDRPARGAAPRQRGFDLPPPPLAVGVMSARLTQGETLVLALLAEATATLAEGPDLRPEPCILLEEVADLRAHLLAPLEQPLRLALDLLD